jgi:hypothetical protein
VLVGSAGFLVAVSVIATSIAAEDKRLIFECKMPAEVGPLEVPDDETLAS